MNAVSEFLIGLFILIGAFLSLVSAFGVLRFPDVYTRNHAASKATTLGVLFTLLGTLIFFFAYDGILNSRIMLGIVFIFITAPVAGHLISRAAYHTDVKMADISVQDDLKKGKIKNEKFTQK